MAHAFGEPITGVFAVSGAQAQLFEHGLIINGTGGEAAIAFGFPAIGRPGIVTGNDPKPFGDVVLSFRLGNWQVAELNPLIQKALEGRVSLVPTGKPTIQVPLTALPGSAVVPGGELFSAGMTSGALDDRQLYDVALRTEAGDWRVVAPHALYHRNDWTSFGIVHVTDMHVARRIDRFRALLIQADRASAAERLYNWNDRFRGFVRYANFLHRIGKLDVIVATGDLYDYMFEDNDDQNGGGNAEFLRKLILGHAPGPEFRDVEELLVPIFLTPGNHDYRIHPYRLIFEVRVRVDLAVTVAKKDIITVPNFDGYHMLREDAAVLANMLEGHRGADIRKLDPGIAARALEVDKLLAPYGKFLSDRGSYIIQLGDHRIAMIDSAHDVGVVTEIWDAIVVKVLNGGTEDQATFVGGSPNCEGVSKDEFDMVSKALAETPKGALFLLGLHAPLFNMWNQEYPYFMRETQRPFQPAEQAHGFLARHAGKDIVTFKPVAGQVEHNHPLWFAGENDHRTRPPTFVKRVDDHDLNADMLDFGVSRGRAEDLMRLLAGIGSHRAADVVLAGHTHRHNEFTLRKMHDGKLAICMDFYTQTPTHYYPTRFTTSWKHVKPPGALEQAIPETDVTYVDIVPGAAADAQPRPMTRDAMFKNQIQVPPYPNPLSDAPDAGAWWSEHRPLVLQTGALGPLDGTQVSFSGFRVLTVKDNVIDKINFIATARLEAHDYRMEWEDAISPDPLPAMPWLPVSEGRSTPGAPLAALLTSKDRITVVLADPGGGVFATSGTPGEGWAPWASVSDGRTTPGGAIAAIKIGEDRVAVFLADPGGGIFTTTGNAREGWAPWSSVSEGRSTPGAPIAAVAIDGGRIALFIADPGGGVFTTSGIPGEGWAPWSSVSEGSTIPGAPITAVSLGGNRVALFLADRGGGVFTTSGIPGEGWAGWSSVSEGSTTPGAPIAAVRVGDGRIQLFLADPGGGIFTTIGSAEAGWAGWSSVSEGSTKPGAPVAAVLIGEDKIALYLADPDGGIFGNSGSASGGWAQWRSASQGRSTPGAPIAAVGMGGERVALILADPNGGIFARAPDD